MWYTTKKPRWSAMTQEQYTTKGRKFQHLTKEKRAQIEILLRQGILDHNQKSRQRNEENRIAAV